jgi:arabinose-5-phosphate isomerase
MSAVAVGQRVIRQEASALEQLAQSLGDTFAAVVDLIYAAEGRVILVGMGKSGHVARKIAATLASTGTPAHYVHPGEASHGDLGMIGRDDVVIALSKSGETPELADLIAYSRRFRIALVGMTERVASALGRAADYVLALPPAPEASSAVDAPTTSTTLMMALGDALAVALLERRGFTEADFGVFHPGGKLGQRLRTLGDLMHKGDQVPLIREDASVKDAVLVMTAKRFGCVGVVDLGGALTGVFTDGDLRRAMAPDLFVQPITAVMTRNPVTAPPSKLAGAGLELMNARSISALFVTEGLTPVGILHLHDLLRAGVS